MVSPAGTWGPHPMGLSGCPADVQPPCPEQSAADNLLSTLAHRQGCNSTPKGVGPQAAAQFLCLTPLPLRTLDTADLKPLIPRVGTMTLAHILRHPPHYLSAYMEQVWAMERPCGPRLGDL